MDSPNLIPALIVAAALIYAGRAMGQLAGELHSIGAASDAVGGLVRRIGGS
jgi:hypothetical protein